MQWKIDNDIKLGKIVSPSDNIGDASEIDQTESDFSNATEKVQKSRKLIQTGKYGTDIVKGITRTLKLAFQGMLEDIDTKDQPAHIFYKRHGTFRVSNNAYK